jgi:glycerol-3-phosphate dehydrogenase (NAD(P)+)
VASLTVFGAGAMGTALAMHAARAGLDTALWANPYDERSLDALRSEGRHPALPEHVPSSLAIHGPEELDQAAKDVEVAVLAATSDTARSLAGMVREAVDGARFLVSLAKGIESDTGSRISEVYGAELPGPPVVVVAGPCLASELAAGAPSAAVWAAASLDDAMAAGRPLATRSYQPSFTDDLAGVEYCTSAKNVAAIGMGLLDGLGKLSDEAFRNAKAAVFTKAIQELCALVEALGGRRETAMGLAGVGDVHVTGTGGRNRLLGELVGEGDEPAAALRQLEGRGMTVEGVASAADVHRLALERGIELPFHQAVYRILVDGEDPRTILDVLV